MRIGELSRRTGVSERSLRYYEQQGLLDAQRTPGGHREYPDRAVARVERIQVLFAAGLCSTKIVSLLPCMRDDGARSEIATSTLVDDLTVERARIDRAIADLVRSRALLDDVIATASPPDRPTVDGRARVSRSRHPAQESTSAVAGAVRRV